MARYLEHPSRASRWTGGVFEVLPEAGDEDATVWFSSTDHSGDGESGAVWEGLLARRISEDRAEIAAVPVFVYDLNLGDEVAIVVSAEGALVGSGLVTDAGRFTYRVLFPATGPRQPDHRWRELHLALAQFGCWLDVYTPTLIAVSADQAVAQDVADYLAGEEGRGRLQYETGRTVQRRV
jgi:hypothetical protein